MRDNIQIENLTIVIPTFNRIDLLKKILDTIPRSMNVIISDNGSSVSEIFANQYKEFQFVKTERILEALENWNRCISLVKTEWFTIPSDDDLYYENSFILMEKYLKKYHDNDVLVFGHNVIDGDGVKVSEWVPKENYNLDPPFSYNFVKYGVDARFPGLFFKKKIVNLNNNFDISYKTTAGDSKLIQMCLLTGKASFIPEIIAGYRVWSNSSTTLTLGNLKWMDEVYRWQNEILPIAIAKFSEKGIRLNVSNIKDEVYARNLIGGIKSKRKSEGLISVLGLFKENSFPWHANFLTKLQLLKKILINEK